MAADEHDLPTIDWSAVWAGQSDKLSPYASANVEVLTFEDRGRGVRVRSFVPVGAVLLVERALACGVEAELPEELEDLQAGLDLSWKV